jgi:hypothetical protein
VRHAREYYRQAGLKLFASQEPNGAFDTLEPKKSLAHDSVE